MNQVLNPRAESRRRRYLELMGLEAYYARKVLENAGPSAVFPLAAEAEKPAAASAPKGADASTAPPPRVRPAPARRPEVASPPRRLHYQRVDSALAVLSQDSWEGEEGAACLDLLRNIVKALGKTFDGAGATTPVLFGRRDGETAGAGTSLEELCQRGPCDNLLIFAHNGGELFPEVSPSTTDFSRVIADASLRVTLTRGLREMLALPELKKHCWRELQPLRARLGGR